MHKFVTLLILAALLRRTINGMVYVHVWLLCGAHSSLVLLDRACCYVKLVDTVVTEFGLDPTKVAVRMSYLLNNDFPPVRITSDSNVLSYMTLKGIDREPSKYPIHVEVTTIEIGQQSISFSMAKSVAGSETSSGELFTLHDIASDICDAVVLKSGHDDEHVVTIVSVPDASNVEGGRVFRDKEVFKLSMSFYAIRNMFEFVIVRSDKKEYVVKCSRDECSWICRSSRLGKTGFFKIRQIGDGHTCVSNIVLGSHRQVSMNLVSSFIRYKYTSSRTIYTPSDICNDMLQTYGVSMNYVKAWRSREKTLKMIRGDPTESFMQLPSFFYLLEQTNHGTVTKLEVDSNKRFKYCFMALGASIQGWLHCRPVIVVDGTNLNGHYGGTLFTACTQDANNSIFILAFGIGDNENDRSWSWFIENLKNAYRTREGLCFVSDRHNSIKNAIERLYPGTYHGICSYHLLQNLKSHYGRSGHDITQAFNSAVRAYTLSEFEYNMQQLDTINEKIRGYLNEVGPERWSRYHMPTNRYSTMTSNIVESVNAVTKSAKNYPIVALLESLCQTIQNWLCKNRDNAKGTFTTLSDKYERLLRDMSADLRKMRVSPANQTIFSVIHEGSSFIVDIENRTCTCRMLQVDQMPCPYTLTVIAFTKGDPYDYCSYFYTREAYLNAYQGTIYPVGNQNDWTVPRGVENAIVFAPNQKRSSGRPAEKRKRSACEGKATVKCGRCGGSGHNRRSCTSFTPLSQILPKTK